MAKKLDIGIVLPNPSVTINRTDLMRFAQTAERAGFESVWSGDHIIWPPHDPSKHPFAKSGVKVTLDSRMAWLDCVGMLTFIAGCTERVKLATGIMIIGLRHPVHNAKLWATLDVVSGGRAMIGVGVGWMEEEFEILGMP